MTPLDLPDIREQRQRKKEKEDLVKEEEAEVEFKPKINRRDVEAMRKVRQVDERKREARFNRRERRSYLSGCCPLNCICPQRSFRTPFYFCDNHSFAMNYFHENS